MNQTPLVVVKVGGSLFDHPALGAGLRRWVRERPPGRLLFLPGGGGMADVIRGYHRTHGVSEEDCHWMAIRAMQVNAFLIKAMLGQARVVGQPSNGTKDVDEIEILNTVDFIREDDSQTLSLPHNWMVTSDSIAARVAEVSRAKLVLLKSVDLPARISWPEASAQGLVDVMFSVVVERANLTVEWVNFRALLSFTYSD